MRSILRELQDWSPANEVNNIEHAIGSPYPQAQSSGNTGFPVLIGGKENIL